MMVKHKLPANLAGRFLPHRKQTSLIFDPVVSSQLYHATYRSFTKALQKELSKAVSTFHFPQLDSMRFRIKAVSLPLLAMILLPQPIDIQAAPAITNQPQAPATTPATIENPVEISQSATIEAYVPKTTKKAAKAATVLTAASLPTHADASVGVTSTFAWPVHGSITTRFSAFHQGIDIPQPYATPIKPLRAGTVIFAGVSTGWGNNVVVDHGDGYSARYAHMSKILTSVGQAVDGETTLGLIGATGWATGNHLHLEIYKNGKAFNPLKALP